MATHPHPFAHDPQVIGVARAYTNPSMIADAVLPPVPVTSKSFAYDTYTKEDAFTVPETRVARLANRNEVGMQSDRATAMCEDHGLDEPIDLDDVPAAAKQGRNLVLEGAEWLRGLLAIGREKRVSDMVFAAGTYPAGNKVQLAGTDQWSDTANSDPVADIVTGMDACVLRPNTMVLGRSVASWLVRHPKLVKAVFGSGTDAGIIPLRALQDLFEIPRIVVGEAYRNSAKKGQTASLARLWGKHCALLHIDPNANASRGITFGFTGRYADFSGGQYFDPKRGRQGAQVVTINHSEKEVIVASDLGYFIEDAVA